MMKKGNQTHLTTGVVIPNKGNQSQKNKRHRSYSRDRESYPHKRNKTRSRSRSKSTKKKRNQSQTRLGSQFPAHQGMTDMKMKLGHLMK